MQVFRDGVVDFQFVTDTKEKAEKIAETYKPGVKFPYEGQTYEIENILPLMEEEKDKFYSFLVRVKV